MDWIFAIIGKIVVVGLLIYGLSEIRVKINNIKRRANESEQEKKEICANALKKFLNECKERAKERKENIDMAYIAGETLTQYKPVYLSKEHLNKRNKRNVKVIPLMLLLSFLLTGCAVLNPVTGYRIEFANPDFIKADVWIWSGSLDCRREVRTDTTTNNYYAWDARDNDLKVVEEGVYGYYVQAGEITSTGKITVRGKF
jgi:hypothetical protein